MEFFMAEMIGGLIIISCIVMLIFILVAPAIKEAEREKEEVENFNVYRRVTVINCLKGDTLFSIEGRMNINADTEDNLLEIIVEIADGEYKKYFIGLSDNVTYTVEDIEVEKREKEEAENFNVYRITVINCLKGDTLFSIEGRMNINPDTKDNRLEIIVEIADGEYKKYFIGLSDNVTYTVEDIEVEKREKEEDFKLHKTL